MSTLINLTILIIFIVFLILLFLVFISRTLSKQKMIKRFYSKWTSSVKRTKDVSLLQHSIMVFFGIIFSILFFLLLISHITLHFPMPSTTAINWFTLHHYPRQQDTFYFISVFSFITITTSLIWLLWIIQKCRK